MKIKKNLKKKAVVFPRPTLPPPDPVTLRLIQGAWEFKLANMSDQKPPFTVLQIKLRTDTGGNIRGRGILHDQHKARMLDLHGCCVGNNFTLSAFKKSWGMLGIMVSPSNGNDRVNGVGCVMRTGQGAGVGMTVSGFKA